MKNPIRGELKIYRGGVVDCIQPFSPKDIHDGNEGFPMKDNKYVGIAGDDANKKPRGQK